MPLFPNTHYFELRRLPSSAILSPAGAQQAGAAVQISLDAAGAANYQEIRHNPGIPQAPDAGRQAVQPRLDADERGRVLRLGRCRRREENQSPGRAAQSGHRQYHVLECDALLQDQERHAATIRRRYRGRITNKNTAQRRYLCCACLQLWKSLAERGLRPQARIHSNPPFLNAQ